jgi:ubiquinone biosynthesis protein UbiJ
MPFALAILFEEAIDRLLSLDPDTRARLDALQGKVICLRLLGAEPIELYLLPSARGVQLRAEHERPADVTLSGELSVFARLALRRLVPEIPAAGEVQISGDIDLGRQFQQLLERIDIDWEELAARIVGDVAAHQLGRAVRGTARWFGETLRTLSQDAAEYLQEESRLLPPRERAAAFRREVQALEAEVERLAARLARLQEAAK